MQRFVRYIASFTLMLLLFVTGAKAIYAFEECHCHVSQIEQKHNCCSCQEHIEECQNHDHKFEHKCNKLVQRSEDAVIVTQKSNTSNKPHFIIKLNTLESKQCELSSCVKFSISPYLNTLGLLPKDQWLPLWRSLRAPPARV